MLRRVTREDGARGLSTRRIAPAMSAASRSPAIPQGRARCRGDPCGRPRAGTRPAPTSPAKRFLNRDSCFTDVAQALLRVFSQASSGELLNSRRRRRRQSTPLRLLHDHGSQGVGNGLAAEGLPSRQHLEQNNSESPNVGAPIHWLAARLLRTHVGRRAQNHPRLCGGSSERGRVL